MENNSSCSASTDGYRLHVLYREFKKKQTINTKTTNLYPDLRGAGTNESH